ncbi:MAG: hypothetical protein H6658_19165 [Ardenticatenaceae bacterium]|nr:hypothetical protein [Ardenticatenaceae bacterium]
MATSEMVAGQEVRLEIVNQIGGAVTAVAVQNNLAYLGIGSRLAVVDVSDPTKPHVISWSGILPRIVQQITLSDELAYVALGEAGLWVFDISDPTTLTLLGQVQTTTPARQFLLHDDLAYVIDSSSPREPGQILSVVDVVDPMKPLEISTFSLPSRATKLVAVDDYLYISIYPYHADYEDTLWVVDISDPDSLQLVTAVPELAGSDMISFDEGLMLLKAKTNWLTIINTDDPHHPTGTSLNSPSGFIGAGTIQLNENIIYVATTFSDAGSCAAGVHAFNIADINNINDLAGLNAVDCGIPKIAIANSYLYIATNSGLSIVDISNPASMVLLGKLPTILPFDQLAFDESLYAMGRQGNGFRVFDFNLDDPINPLLVGEYEGDYLVNDFAVAGSHVFLATYWQGIALIDMTDPTNPQETAVTAPEYKAENSSNLVLSDNRLYASLNSNLGVFDSVTLEWLGGDEIEGYGNYGSFVVDNHTLWTWTSTSDGDGLLAIDVTNPNQLTQIGFLPGGSGYSNKRLFVNQGYIYVLSHCDYLSENLCQGTTLSIIDVTDPTAMRFVTTVTIADPIRRVAIYDETLLLVGGDLWLMDVLIPDQPYIAGSFQTPGYTQDVVFLDDLIYIADGSGGLLVLRLME